MLQEEHKPPSASLCYRNRFMFTMGFYRYMAIASARLLALGPVISWATMDASPQQGWDWFMHGRLRISTRNLIEYSRKAVRYICVCRQLADDEDDISSNQHVLAEEVKLRLFLQDVLRLQMGVPGCTGAGRSGVRHKLHAWVHSERLTSMSWGDAVMLVNISFTIAGDMGTEMHMSSSRVLFRALFGQWPMDVDEIYIRPQRQQQRRSSRHNSALCPMTLCQMLLRRRLQQNSLLCRTTLSQRSLWTARQRRNKIWLMPGWTYLEQYMCRGYCTFVTIALRIWASC